MLSFDKFLSKNKTFLILLALLGFSVFLMLFSTTWKEFKLRSLFFNLLYPFQNSFHITTKWFNETWNSINELKKLKTELEKTRNRLKELENATIEFAELAKENSILRDMLDFKQRFIYKTILAEVIGKSPENFYQSLIINKGSDSGIRKNNAVIAYMSGKKSLVGKIIEVTNSASKVITIIDQSSYVSVMIKTNRIQGLMQGGIPSPEKCRIQYIKKGISINTTGDELVITSGGSNIYPKGLEVGRILKVIDRDPNEIFQEIDIMPTTDFSRLEYVFVIQWEKNSDIEKLHNELSDNS